MATETGSAEPVAAAASKVDVAVIATAAVARAAAALARDAVGKVVFESEIFSGPCKGSLTLITPPDW